MFDDPGRYFFLTANNVGRLVCYEFEHSIVTIFTILSAIRGI